MVNPLSPQAEGLVGKEMITRFRSPALRSRWHSGIVDVDQSPPALFSLIELCFPGRES